MTIAIAAIALVAQSSAPAAPPQHVPVLPQVRRHLEQAQEFLDSSLWDLAAAHAGLVLVTQDFAVSMRMSRLKKPEEDTGREALSAACDAWSKALEGRAHFHFVDNPNQADLRFTFQPDVRMGRDAVAGLTSWSRKLHVNGIRVESSSYRADISIRSRWLDRSSLPFEPVRQEIEHELGHVLGLDDSAIPGSVMGRLYLGRLIPAPAPHEVATVLEIRNTAEKIRTSALSHLKPK